MAAATISSTAHVSAAVAHAAATSIAASGSSAALALALAFAALVARAAWPLPTTLSSRMMALREKDCIRETETLAATPYVWWERRLVK